MAKRTGLDCVFGLYHARCHLNELAELGRQRACEVVVLEGLRLERRGRGDREPYHAAGVACCANDEEDSLCTHGDESRAYHILRHLIELAELGRQRSCEFVCGHQAVLITTRH